MQPSDQSLDCSCGTEHGRFVGAETQDISLQNVLTGRVKSTTPPIGQLLMPQNATAPAPILSLVEPQ